MALIGEVTWPLGDGFMPRIRRNSIKTVMTKFSFSAKGMTASLKRAGQAMQQMTRAIRGSKKFEEQMEAIKAASGMSRADIQQALDKLGRSTEGDQ